MDASAWPVTASQLREEASWLLPPSVSQGGAPSAEVPQPRGGGGEAAGAGAGALRPGGDDSSDDAAESPPEVGAESGGRDASGGAAGPLWRCLDRLHAASCTECVRYSLRAPRARVLPPPPALTMPLLSARQVRAAAAGARVAPL
jgi:hypothetical protein